jgi:hypothetical protein
LQHLDAGHQSPQVSTGHSTGGLHLCEALGGDGCAAGRIGRQFGHHLAIVPDATDSSATGLARGYWRT